MDDHPSELDALAKTLDDYRAICRWKAEGLTEEEARVSHVPSGTSILGTIKHLAFVERFWFQTVIAGLEVDYPWTDDDPDADWRIEDHESLETVLALYDGEVAESQRITAGLTEPAAIVAVGSRRHSVRSVLIHAVEEIARHAGHLDFMRELTDGSTGWGPEAG